MDADKIDGEYYCPKCKNLLPEEDCVQHSAPRGMPSCLLSCYCQICDEDVCCKREGPEPRLEPKSSKKSAPGM